MIPAGPDIEGGNVYIQTVDAFGLTLNTYTYYGADGYDDGSAAGWYTDSGLAEVTFSHGEGLFVFAPDAETTITSAGAVPTSDVAVFLQAGATATLNMMPINIDIQDILPAGPDIEGGNVYIQTVDAFGLTLNTYTYYGADGYDDGSAAGWYTDNGLAEVTFAAGEGMAIFAPDAETSVTFPAPEL